MGGILDQPHEIMTIMNIATNGYSLGKKNIKDYTTEDTNQKRAMDILKRIKTNDNVKWFIDRACGKDAIQDGRISDEMIIKYDLQLVAVEVRRWLQDLS